MNDRKTLVRAIYRVLSADLEEGRARILSSAVADELEALSDPPPPVRSNLNETKRKGRPPGSKNRPKIQPEDMPQPDFSRAITEETQEAALKKAREKPLIVTPDSHEGRAVLKKTKGDAIQPIRLGPGGVKRREDHLRDKWDLRDLMEETENNTPTEITVTPNALGFPVTLSRRIIRNDAIKAMKLVYQLDNMRRPEAPGAVGWAARTAGVDTPAQSMPLDYALDHTFTTSTDREIDFDGIVNAIRTKAEATLRPLETVIVNHTPIRTGHLRIDLTETAAPNGRAIIKVRGGVSGDGVQLTPTIERSVQKGVSFNAGDLPKNIPANIISVDEE
jgi:hypothetical protein